ncbi:MAG: PQQ-like beta-propeller repeat protein [Planctomycetes bacterium]|nr:PQQ-like beta-propeller repeat protein [Planctomycetota bacterium]
MVNAIRAALVVSFIFCIANNLVRADDKKPKPDTNWPAWRGPLGNGVAAKGKPPTEWGEDKNIKWKVAIPGKGHATPIIWGDRVYVQTAVETQKENVEEDGEKKASVQAESILPDGNVRLDSAQPGGDQPPRTRRGGRRGPGGRPGGRGGFGGAAPKHVFEFQVIALDRKTGETVWTKTVREEKPHEAGHGDASQASNSPVTDGKHIYAYFGSRGLYCLDLDGNVKWEKDFGKMETAAHFGEGSSPVLHGNTLVIVWDHEGADFIVALDKKTGKELWKKDRDERTSWCTPVVVEANGKPQVVVCNTTFIRAYDLKTGKEVWRCTGMTGNTIPTPLVVGDMLYAISGFRGAAALAIKYAEAKGDITDKKAIVWKYDQDTPYVPTGVAYKNRLYFVENNRPILTCLNTKTGKPAYDKQRLAGLDSIYASFVAAGGHIYIAGREGATLVLEDGPEFKVLATNTLDDGFDASPAIAGNELYLRSRSHLYCIAE